VVVGAGGGRIVVAGQILGLARASWHECRRRSYRTATLIKSSPPVTVPVNVRREYCREAYVRRVSRSRLQLSLKTTRKLTGCPLVGSALAARAWLIVTVGGVLSEGVAWPVIASEVVYRARGPRRSPGSNRAYRRRCRCLAVTVTAWRAPRRWQSPPVMAGCRPGPLLTRVKLLLSGR